MRKGMGLGKALNEEVLAGCLGFDGFLDRGNGSFCCLDEFGAVKVGLREGVGNVEVAIIIPDFSIDDTELEEDATLELKRLLWVFGS